MLTYSSYLQKNQKFIQENKLGLNDYPFDQVTLSDDVCIYRTRTAKLSLKYKDQLLHSLYDPDREARRFAISQEVEAGDFLLVYGFGLGYHLKYLMELVGPEGKVFIFEPNLDILNAALILVDFQEIVRMKQVRIITGQDEDELAFKLSGFISREFANIPPEKKKVVIHLPSFKCFPDVSDRIKETFDLLLINRKASEVFGDVQLENFTQNFEMLLRSPRIESLRNQTAGHPAFFVNAGPSLDKSFKFLHEVTSHAFIFASDSAYSFLNRMKIPVDVVFSVDPQAETQKHFAEALQSRSILAALPTMHHETLKNFIGPKLCVLQKGNSVTKEFESLLEDKSITEAVGSVSCIGLDLILKLQCNPVIFLGMDYAFPANKFYFSEGEETKKWYERVSRFNTPEMMHYDIIQGEDLMYVQDKKGRKIPANKTLYLYLRQIEEIIGRHPEATFYNFFSQGAKIRGTRDLTEAKELKEILPCETLNKNLSVEYTPIDSEIKNQILETLKKNSKKKSFV